MISFYGGSDSVIMRNKTQPSLALRIDTYCDTLELNRLFRAASHCRAKTSAVYYADVSSKKCLFMVTLY